MNAPITGDIVTPDEFAHERALAAAIVSAIGDLLDKRTDDLPHRFRAPAALAQYFNPEFPNQTYQYSTSIRGNTKASQYDQQQIMGTTNSAMPLVLRITTRPAQSILELEFDDAYGTRLFTLEIEYGAVPKTREVLLPSWSQIYKTPNHRNTYRKETTKASSFLSECLGLNWPKISLKLGAELTQLVHNLNP